MTTLHIPLLGALKKPFNVCHPSMHPLPLAMMVLWAAALWLGAGAQSALAETSSSGLEEVTVVAAQTANDRPAATYAGVLSALRFDPLIELQSRGLSEAQADITVRGGIFENTALQIDAATLFDPQTGHYAANVPIDPGFLTQPELALDIDHAVVAGNATLATIQYRLTPVVAGGVARLGAGSHGLNYQQLQASTEQSLQEGTAGLGIALARSEGNGTVADGDHHFERLNLRAQWRSATSQTDAMFAYQDKFYGWPGAYTGFATLPEVDDTQTTLWMLSHRQQFGAGNLTATAFQRTLVDDYDFDRRTFESGGAGAFDHKTRVRGLAVAGNQQAKSWRLRWSLQYSDDELLRSTDLTAGRFTTRAYFSARVVPEYRWSLPDAIVAMQLGASLDRTNRDGDVLQPIAGITWSAARSDNVVALTYVGSSQVPGYTALNSPTQGLFGGNPDLGRERAQQLTLSWRYGTAIGEWRMAGFLRNDDDLVDWTYLTSVPFSRQANPVDLDVAGVELIWQQALANGRWSAGVTWLDKSADYGSALVDASFYALNYAEWRGTTSWVYAPTQRLTARFDAEWRQQANNPLRQSADNAFIAAASLTWNVSEAFSWALIVDNLTDADFEFFPGTPAVGRQGSVSVSYQF